MTISVRRRIIKQNIFTSKHLSEYLSYLITVVRIKKKLKVCVRDIYLLGLDRKIDITRFGILLNRLYELGLAKKIKNSRPRKYRLEPQQLWIKFVDVCDFRCNSDSTLCSLIGVCPYWVLKNGYS